MSLVKELYEIFDQERSKYIERKSTKNQLVLEISRNLAFLREGLAENLKASDIISGLEDRQYRVAGENGANLDAIQKKKLAKSTYGGAREFDRYQGWSTAKLINNGYERIATLKKLDIDSGAIDIHSRLQYLFKYLMVVMAHIEGEPLAIDGQRSGAAAK